MFSISLKNSCQGYRVYLDDNELQLDYKSNNYDYSTSQDYSGKHSLKIKKDLKKIKSWEILLFWISALLTSYDESFVALYRSAKEINIEFFIEVGENFTFEFDTYTNQVKKCNGKYYIVNEKCAEDIAIKSKINFYIKLPLMLLTLGILVPLWVLSILMLISAFDAAGVLIFSFTSVLLSLSIIAFVRDRKNKW